MVRRETGRVSLLGPLLTCSFDHLRFLLIQTDLVQTIYTHFIYIYIYIYIYICIYNIYIYILYIFIYIFKI